MYNTWCLSVSPDILNIPDIPNIPHIPAIPKVPDIPDAPFYYHAKSGAPSSKIGRVIAIWKMCANLFRRRREEEKENISSILLDEVDKSFLYKWK